VTTILFLWAFADPAQSAPLTIGSPAPKLAAMTFVRGEAVKELAKGTIYVIEFSGTTCVPCIQCIPHVNALQKKHADVVFLSVFGADEKTVRAFLEDKGKAMAIRVACDPSDAMKTTWSDPACREGIPHAFIVDKNGRVAWIGHPAEMGEPLAGIIAGNFDAQETILRLKVEQEAAMRLRRAEEREEKGRTEYNRINELIIAGKLEEALTATDKALVEYRGAPATTSLLRGARLYLLANLPGRRETAFELGTEMAIEAKVTGRSGAMTNAALSLLNAAERAKPASRDTRLIDLALPLLRQELPADLLNTPDPVLKQYQAECRQFVGYAYHLRGEPKRATESIREAIVMTRALKPPPGADPTAFAERIAMRLKDLEASLAEYEAAAPMKRP
jgi:tetratricopeptide (TPR) repeat protein